MASDVPAVAAAVRMLERLAREWPDPLSTGALIDELKLNRSTCYNILGTLQRAGWASSRGDRSGWLLGPRLLALTGAPADLVARVVQEELDDLSQRLGFVAFLVERHGSGGYAVVAKAERGQGVRITVGIGNIFPFFAPAIMLAFHAWTEPAEFDRLLDRYGTQRFTERTVTDRASLHELLSATRRRGYGLSVKEYDLAQSGVSAPVFDRHGNVSAVVCLLAFSTELGDDQAEQVEQVGRLVRDCGLRITARTGGAPPA